MSMKLVEKIDEKIDEIAERYSGHTQRDSKYTIIKKFGDVPKIQITVEDHEVFTAYTYDITIRDAVPGGDEGESYHGGFNIAGGRDISADVAEKIADLDTALGRVLQYGK